MTTLVFGEKENSCLRFAFSFSGLSRRAVSYFFHQEFPSEHLPSILNKNYTTLYNLKSSGKLRQSQWDRLFPVGGVAYSESFDAGLMISLIINLTSIIPPTNGFNNLPLKEETTPASDLARIKWFNECQFLYDTIDAHHFYTVCKDISPAVIRLGDTGTRFECEALWQSNTSSTEEIAKLTQATDILSIGNASIRDYSYSTLLDTSVARTVLISAEQIKKAISLGSQNQSFITSHEETRHFIASPRETLRFISSPRETQRFVPLSEDLEDKFSYPYNAFPRCKFLVESFGYPYESQELVQVNVFHDRDHIVDKSEFVVKKEDVEGNTNGHDFLPVPYVNVCMLRCSEDGSFSKDESLFKKFQKSFSHTWRDIFVIDGELNDTQLCDVSEKIAEVLNLELKCNDVLHSLFPRQTEDIAIRLSLLLEKQLIASIEAKESPLIDDIADFRKQNESDLLYHQLKYVSMRNEKIYEFGNENDKQFVSIDDMSNRKDVEDFLKKYLPKPNNIEVHKFNEKVVKNLSLQSGDKVCVKSHMQTGYGTVGLCLTDIDHLYCATCNHVVENVKDPANEISITSSNMVNTIHTQENPITADQIITSSDEFDFSLVKLVGKDIKISSGLRNENDKFVKGRVFGRDMLLLPSGTTVYKWGATSSLTFGKYEGRWEQVRTTEHAGRKNQTPFFKFRSNEGEVFAKEGDSGSLICYRYKKYEVAAIILNGRLDGEHDLFVGCKLADALESCKQKLPELRDFIHTTDDKLNS